MARHNLPPAERFREKRMGEQFQVERDKEFFKKFVEWKPNEGLSIAQRIRGAAVERAEHEARETKK